jgi:hypothetical protein
VEKVALAVCLLIVFGVAASYPAWSQLIGQFPASAVGIDSTSATTSNSTEQASPDVPSPPNSAIYAPTTTTQTAAGIPFGQAWVSQFLGVVDANRGGSALSDCPRLDSFAMSRFNTMTTGNNWEVVHYGYSQGLQQTFGGSAGLYSEVYFYPTTPTAKTPQGFATLVQTTAQGHWSDLTNPEYRYYGAYYAGTGPILLFQSGCVPGEFGAGVNQTQYFPKCAHQQVNGTWLVIELSSVCE